MSFSSTTNHGSGAPKCPLLRLSTFWLSVLDTISSTVCSSFFMPSDPWIVAMDEIKKQGKNGLVEMNIDLDKLMSEVKRQHPNLFVDMEAMMKGGLEN